MLYKNAHIFTVDKGFVYGHFTVDGDRFGDISEGFTPEDGVDLEGAYVIPGLIDVHSHGNSGEDFSDGNYAGLLKISEYLAKNGITAFAPASMTLPYDVLEKAFACGKKLHDEAPEGHSRLMGIQMEGPYFSEKKKGAQNGAYLKLPDYEGFKTLFDGCDGLIKFADVAPELPGAVEFTEKVSKLTRVSVAHTDASYEEALAVFKAGASHLTHLYNAMPSIHHRRPGVIGAASENENVVAELICDGLHVHESAVRMAFRLFPDRICLVSDALRCCGMPDGQYTLGGQDIWLNNKIARLADGTIAGAASNLYDGLLNAIRFGIRVEDAITSVTLTPAKELGCADVLGSIEKGKFADFNVCSETFERKMTYIGGKKVG